MSKERAPESKDILGIELYKFLDPLGATTHEGRLTYYPLPRVEGEWGPWFWHPEPGVPDGQSCGPGGWHGMKNLDASYAPQNWWPWRMQGAGLLGEDEEKVRVVACRLQIITIAEFWQKLRDGQCRGVDLSGANLRGADLSGAVLPGTDLYWANLSGADLYWANLRGANLRGTDLRGANLYGANLYWADLSGADLSGANLYGADLRGTDLRGANLTGAIGVESKEEKVER